MKRPKRGGAKPLHQIPLLRGVSFHARALDPFQQAVIDAEVERETLALVRGEPTQRDWGLDEDRRAALAADAHARRAFGDWMKLVVLAAHTVERVEGVSEDDGTPCAPSFDLFALLLEETAFAESFKRGVVLLMLRWDDEKNGSGAAPNGLSAAAPNTAETAAPETTLISGNPAPEASPSAISTDATAAALTTSTPPSAPPAPSLGASLEAPAPGSPASADSLDSTGSP